MAFRGNGIPYSSGALRRCAASLVSMDEHLLRHKNSESWRWAAELVRGCPSFALYRVPEEILQDVVFFSDSAMFARGCRSCC